MVPMIVAWRAAKAQGAITANMFEQILPPAAVADPHPGRSGFDGGFDRGMVRSASHTSSNCRRSVARPCCAHRSSLATDGTEKHLGDGPLSLFPRFAAEPMLTVRFSRRSRAVV
jgi:hypothetical protein